MRRGGVGRGSGRGEFIWRFVSYPMENRFALSGPESPTLPEGE